jgi:hypothetical protein
LTLESNIFLQMKFTKIVDMTDTESIISQADQDAIQKLEYDDEMMLDSEEGRNLFQHDLEVLLPESKEIMKEWTCAEIKVDEINTSDLNSDRNVMSPTGSSSSIESMDSFYKPEADQKEHDEELLSEHVVSALRRDTKEYATITRDIEE